MLKQLIVFLDEGQEMIDLGIFFHFLFAVLWITDFVIDDDDTPVTSSREKVYYKLNKRGKPTNRAPTCKLLYLLICLSRSYRLLQLT
jgi:hypothetical protein